MLGAESYVQPMFNGAVLIVAVVAARLGALRRDRRSVAAARVAMTDEAVRPRGAAPARSRARGARPTP